MQIRRRQRWLVRFLMLGVLAVAVDMGSSVQAQTTSTGPYYATPSWDQTLPAATRFIVLSNFNNEAVLDRNTGLVWEKAPHHHGNQSWSDARVSCLNNRVGRQMGWRLPSIVELSSLVDPTPSRSREGLPPGHPFVQIATRYWSATTNVLNSTEVWVVEFADTFVRTTRKDGLPEEVWCVRGGMNSDPY